MHMIFIYLGKTYDSMSSKQLWEAMNNSEKWINLIQKLYNNTKAQVKVSNNLT